MPSSAAARNIPAEWQHLREWFAANRDVLSAAGIGARCGLSRAQAKALLDPSPEASKNTRTAATTERLDNLQRISSAYGYEPPTAHHQML